MVDSPLTAGRWRTCDLHALLRQRWDDQTFVFNPASGHTHLLNDAAMTLLETLAQQPASLEELRQRLFPEGDTQTHQALAAQFEQLVLTGLLCSA